MTETNANTRFQNICAKITDNKDKLLQCKQEKFEQFKQTMLKYGRKGMMIHNTINVAFFGLAYLGIQKANFFKNQHKGLRIIGNILIAGAIYKALWSPRTTASKQAVPFIMQKLNLSVSQEQRKQIQQRFKAFKEGKGFSGPFSSFFDGPFQRGGCGLSLENKDNQKKQGLLSEAGISGKIRSKLNPSASQTKI